MKSSDGVRPLTTQEGSTPGSLPRRSPPSATSGHPQVQQRNAEGIQNKKRYRVKPLTIGAWNVRTLLDRSTANRPERRTALIARELARYNLHIVALSETRFADEGEITEKKAGYTFFWSGRKEEEKREAGVGFAIKSSLINKLASPPKGINDRLMTVRLPLTDKKFVTLISAYAPTMTNPDENKEKFYEDLVSTIESVPISDKLIVLGDFNARVGQDHAAWPGILGKQGIGKCNSNGQLLLEMCASHELLITNTLFRLPNRNKTTWMHPRSKHWHMIDYILVRQKDKEDIRVTKAMCGAECWTDHRLLLAKLNLKIKPIRRPQSSKSHKKLNIQKILQQSTKDQLAEEMSKQLETLQTSNDIEEDWKLLKEITYSTALSVLGPTQRKHQDWFDQNDEEIGILLEKKHASHKALLSDPTSIAKKTAFNKCRSTVQSELRKMQDSWLNKKASEIQNYADKNDIKNFYSALKAIYGPTSSGSSPLLSSDGSQLISDQDKVLERWAEHFCNVLNRPSSISQEAIDNLPQVPINESLDVPPNTEDVIKAIKQLSDGKAAGKDSIPAEIFKFGGPKLINKITELFQLIWDKRKLPQDLKDASIVHLYKKKGNRNSCDNHRGISLLSIAGKILARILLNRLNNHLEDGHLPESQCGFRSGRGTADMVFAARQLQEKCLEQNMPLYSTFVDLTKAFDTVSREGLWQIMSKFGCPETFIAIIREFHDGMQASVQDNGVHSEPFQVSNGVKQGCVLAPTLFSLMFSAMLIDAFKEDSFGVDIRYRYDGGGLFKPTRLKAPTKVNTDSARDFLFADDCALNATSERDMQASMNLFSKACKNFGLTISIAKTEVLHQPSPGSTYIAPIIKCDGQPLPAVDKFTYLGSTLSRSANLDDEVTTRLSKASSAFGRLRDKAWDRRGIHTKTKINVYKAVVLPTLLYGCETWTVYSRHAKKLNSFHLKCLRKILRIKQEDKIPDTEVLERAESESIHALLKRSQLRWAGHVRRMPDCRIPKKLLYGELAEGKRSHGGQKKRYKDTLKATLKDCKINPNKWEETALDRSAWRQQTKAGVTQFEADRITEQKRKREVRKASIASTDPSALNLPSGSIPHLPCPHCSRFFRARIGLTSHLRTHSSSS